MKSRKQERVDLYNDEDMQKLNFILYLILSAMMTVFTFSQILSANPTKIDVLVAWLVGAWVIASAIQVIANYRGYVITTRNMIVMIMSASLLILMCLFWLLCWFFPTSVVPASML